MQTNNKAGHAYRGLLYRCFPYLVLALLAVFFCWLFGFRNGVFGSKVDWISQHSVLPDYFRQLFYDTKQFFPEFAANIGGGQNIYNFSYYGLYSPILLISYLLPWVDMGLYIMVSMIICLVIAVCLLYRWMTQKGISPIVGFMAAVLFMLSGPLIFHSYNQIMFVNYMPFLCLALIGVDRYFDKDRVGLYTISVWLMIMTSFYFSIGGMLVLVIYGIYRYMEDETKRQNWKKTFLPEGLKFMVPMMIALFMSAILLVPTAFVLVGGRNSGGRNAIAMWKLFVPYIRLSGFLYSPYGIGLSAIVIVALLSGLLYRKYSELWLHIACTVVFIIPVFSWGLNGGLYIRSKVMIPFIPLLCFMIAKYVEKLRRGEIAFVAALIPYLVTLVILLFGKKQIYIIDGVILLASFLLCYRKKCAQYILLSSLIVLTCYGVGYNQSHSNAIESDFYNSVTADENRQKIDELTQAETGFFRTEENGNIKDDAANLNRIWSTEQYISSIYSSVENKDYQNFRINTFMTEQPYRNLLMQSCAHNSVFQDFMGVKYIVSKKDVPGCRKIADGVYENEDALPIVYYTNHVMSQEQYSELGYPYNQVALLSYAVAEDEISDNTKIDILKDGMTRVDVKFAKNRIKIEDANEGDLFLLQFKVNNKCPSEDVVVSVGNIRNKLTAQTHIYYNGNTEFTYAVPLREGQTSVRVKFGKGDYKISGVKGYIWKKSAQTNQREKLVQSEFSLDKSATKGNTIKGTIQAGEDDGYLITSIPYDENFKVYVDGKNTTYEKVNTAFLGMKLSKGMHEIEIVYHAPGLMVGKILSLAGILGFLIIEIVYRKHRKF